MSNGAGCPGESMAFFPSSSKACTIKNSFKTSVTNIASHISTALEQNFAIPSFIRFFLPRVPNLSQKDSSFPSSLFGVTGRGDLDLGEAILKCPYKDLKTRNNNCTALFTVDSCYCMHARCLYYLFTYGG